MIAFAQAMVRRHFRWGYIEILAIIQAILVCVVAIAQLFTYENFADVLVQLGIFNGPNSVVVAALVVTIEVFSLAYLLPMALSRLMHVMSMMCSMVVGGFWLYVGWYTMHAGRASENIGLLGDTIAVPSSWWTVLYVSLLCCMVVVNVWLTVRQYVLVQQMKLFRKK